MVHFFLEAGVAELADAHDSKSCGRKAVMVRFHSPAYNSKLRYSVIFHLHGYYEDSTLELPPLRNEAAHGVTSLLDESPTFIRADSWFANWKST